MGESAFSLGRPDIRVGFFSQKAAWLYVAGVMIDNVICLSTQCILFRMCKTPLNPLSQPGVSY